eukprot:7045567-Karenia_brevis.AAC.1
MKHRRPPHDTQAASCEGGSELLRCSGCSGLDCGGCREERHGVREIAAPPEDGPCIFAMQGDARTL